MVIDMDEKELREILLDRLHLEVQLFKDSMLRKSKSDIYASSYKIETYINLHEILADQVGQMKKPLLRKLLYQPSGILDAFYEEWLTRDDDSYMELHDYVEDELNIISASRIYKAKEDEYGGKYYEAA